MGGTNYSADLYAARSAHRARTGAPVFTHDAAIASGSVAAAAHKSLDPMGVKVRESRDSPAHPNARPVITYLDVTGSMQTVPEIVQKNLCKLMGLLVQRGYLEHAAIMTGAIGDAFSDRVPFQVGQFESGIEIENDLTNLYLEGAGGGQTKESYDIGLYFAARHTVSDAWEKRQEKGYLFIIGDEAYYPTVRREQIEKLIGAKLEADIPIEQIVEELKERWHVYFIMPKLTQHFGNHLIVAAWKKLLGENVILLEEPDGIAECIATQIGMVEGKIDVDKAVDDMVAAGTDRRVAGVVGRALIPAGAGSGKPTGTDLTAPDSGGASGVATL